MYNVTGATPLLLNFAQRSIDEVCGRWDIQHMGSQEECIERRSVFYRYGIDPKFNGHLRKILSELSQGSDEQFLKHHVPEWGCVYNRRVPIVRDQEWAYYDEPFFVDVLAIGAIDLRYQQMLKDGERNRYFGGLFSSLDEELFCEHTKNKIRIILISAALLGHKDLILGAIGCGAFSNPPKLVSKCFAQVLGEEMFIRLFRNIVFSVLGSPNFEIFSEIFPPISDFSVLSLAL
eukprot:TRINITY_DN4297_c0_g1_i3.p1 TRINITY_DN4297_c0_g1~~TRINITY_DN4297_c0_g1_i3.p1  ORF type:complete len:233 (-),score=37.38 TRINITY_DN4297_c0_g1_i3:85-783(-)